MNKYKIIHVLKIQGKSLVVLNHKRNVEDMGKTKVIISGNKYSFSLTHNEQSIIINTCDEISGKDIYFE